MKGQKEKKSENGMRSGRQGEGNSPIRERCLEYKGEPVVGLNEWFYIECPKQMTAIIIIIIEAQ